MVASRGGPDRDAVASAGTGLALLAVGLAALAPLAVAWLRATPSPPEASADLVRTDPRDPSIRFRLPLVPPGWSALAGLGLLLYAALGALRALFR
jgi:hypothetical protein